MRKILLPLLLLLAAGALGGTTFTSKSMLFADSYMLRAQGCDANYWNPALLNAHDHDLWLPAINLGIYAGNNSLSLDLYNYVMEQDYLDDADKQHILDAIDGKLDFNFGGQISIFGLTLGNTAFTSSIHLGGRAAITEKVVQLALYGNGDGSEIYEFNKAENNASALAYLDFTLGMGDIRIPLPETIPDIKFGFAASLLAGIGTGNTEKVDGRLSSNLDGLNADLDALLRAGAGGYGFKGLLGLCSEPLPNLRAGITLDNVFGFLKWGAVRRDYRYQFAADSVYVADIQSDIEELYTDELTETKGDPFTTNLPPELRLSALYKMNQASLSVDLVKGFGEGPNLSKTVRFAIGAELTPLPILPLYLGFGSGNDSYPWRVSYGIGVNLKALQFGLGIQSLENLLPGHSSKGIAFASYFNLRI